MKKQTIIVKPNMEGYKDVTDRIGQILLQGKPCTIDITEGERKKRSLPANALYAVWVEQIAKHEGKLLKDVRGEHKRDFGVDIILAGDTQYSTVLAYVLEKTNYEKMTYEQKAIFLQVISVTSEMTTQQHNFFREQLQNYYAEQGLILEVIKQ